MLKLPSFRTVFILGCILFTSHIANAAIIPYNAPRIYTIPGTPVVTGANTTVQIPTPYIDPSFSDVSVTDKITLAVDHMNMNYLPTPGDVLVTLKLEQWNNLGVLSTTYPVLELKYQPFNTALPYVDKSVFKFNGAYKFKITIQTITVGGTATTTLPSNLYLDADILLERYTSFATATSPIGILSTVPSDIRDLDCDLVNDELQINWPTIAGVEEYQLEWTFVNDYGTAVGSYVTACSLNYDFKNNSTRITTTNTSYLITLTFEHGYLLYRVRGIGRDLTNPAKNVVGVWSVTADKGTVCSVSSKYFNTQAYEANKNWQYSATYAEEGKKKEVISYFDGSLRNRQSVTKVNTEKNTIVGETIYDHQGRPAINVLPVPVKNPLCTLGLSETSLKFYPNFNRVDATNAYTRADFDLDVSATDTCSPLIKGMNVVSGASNYYSASNPDKTGQQAFLPDAELYPFSQIEYTPDNTGRIRRQGGVGKEFQLDKKHTTKYFYGWPQQPQLDRLFGSEVGDASHYKKNLLVDANGQVSVSYLDQEGRTIATSLAGDAPKDPTNTFNVLEPLTSLPGTSTPMVVDMFAKDATGKSSVNLVNVQEDGIEFVSQLLVAYQSDYEFTYNLSIDKMTDPCLKSTVCINCVYDLEIKITDDCGRIVTPITGSNPNVKNMGKFTANGAGELIGFNLICTTPSLYSATPQVVKVNLPVGNYTVTKKLTVNKASKDFYVAAFLERTFTPEEEYVNLQPGCIRTYQSFLDTALAHLDTADCNISCQTCAASLKKGYATFEEARDAWVAAGNGTELDFDYLLEECNAPCRETSVCATNFEMMLMDMSPDGQYAEFQTKANGDAPDMVLSVFNTGNLLTKNLISSTGNWRNPKITISGTEYGVYIDEHGVRTRIPVALTGNSCPTTNFCTPKVDDCTKVYYDATTNTYFTYPENLASVSDFVANWNDNWAKSLVIYHPEYPYYESCLDYNKKPTNYSPSVLTSDTFDSLLVHSRTYLAAYNAGLIQASSTSPAAAPAMILFNVPGSTIKDPFLFGTSPANFSTYSAALIAKMSSYQGGYSMAAFAAMAARCGTIYGTGTPAANCDDFGNSAAGTEILDNEWNIFKNMYLSEKQKLQKERDDSYARQSANNGYNGCIGNSSYNPFSCGMGLYSPYMSSPFFASFQPCNWTHAFFYKNKKKRFYPNSNLTAPSEDETDYQAYVQTGQCPLALDVQFLLTTLAYKGDLTNTTGANLQFYPEFSEDLYVAVSGGTMPGTYVPYFWDVSTTTSTTLNATIRNATTGLCNFTLTKPTSITNWSDIVGISQIEYTSNSAGIYYFDAVAAIANAPGSSVPFTYVPISGSTCINITNCSFQNQCEPNDLATDLSVLWSALGVNGKFPPGTAPSSMILNTSVTNYSAFITPAIKNALLTSSNNLLWHFNGTQYELYDAAVPAKKLLIQFTSGSLTNVKTFIDIKSTGSNGFTVKGMSSTGTLLSTLTGTVNLVNGTTIGVSMGECGLPDPILCEGDEYQLREDLDELLESVLLRNPFDYNPDLAAEPAYTTLLQSYVGPSVQQSTTKYDYFILNAANDYKEQLLFNILCKCKITLWHKGTSSPVLKFEDLVSLGTLTPNGPVASDNNQYQFYMLSSYNIGGTIYTDTIFGESCFPLKMCTPSIAPDTVLSPQAPYVNPCILYEINIAHVNAQNQYDQYVDSLTTYIADKYNSHCLTALENLSAAYNDKEYHFTLYYYDQAGNLVKTVPPEGVELVTSPADFTEIINDRTYNRHNFFTSHRLATTYEYNSLNQLVRQGMPDHNMMDIWEYTLPNGLDSRLKVTATQFVNSTKGYLSGYIDFTVPSVFKRGYMYTTEDGGATWTKMNDLVASDLKKVQMIDASVGYAVGNHGFVLKTVDGGNTWDMFPTGSVNMLNDLYFTNATNGVVIGNNSTIYKTINGGTTWTSSAGGVAASLSLTGVTYDGTNLYLAGNTSTGFAMLYKASVTLPLSTFTIGTWTLTNAVQTTDVLKVQLVTGTTYGFAISTDGNLLKSTTSGTSWVMVPSGISDGFKDIYFKTPVSGPVLEGVAIIDSIPGKGLLWKTTDGGVTWNLLSAHDGSYYNALHFYQNDKGYAVGNRKFKRIVMTGGIGLVNLPLPKPAAFDLTSVYFSDGNNGWASSATKAYYTNNAMAAAPIWTELPYSGFVIQELYFDAADNTGLALATSQRMYKITWSGSTYSFTLITTSERYIDMSANATKVYAFDVSVTTNNVKYINRIGAISSAGSLTALTSGTLSTASSVKCIYSDNTTTAVYIGGSSGLLYKGATTGTTVAWTDYSNTITPLAVYDIQSAGANNIYAVGKEGTLLQTLNGGTLWKTLPTGTVTQYNAIKFNKAETTSPYVACSGLIAGNGGLLTKQDITVTGIVTATPVPLTIFNDLNDIALNTSNKAYVAGTAGTMISIPTIATPVPAIALPKPAQTFNGVCFRPTTNTVFAVGANAVIYNYNSTSGAKINAVYTPGLNDVHFINPLNGYTIGEKNTVRHTDNGGLSWSYVPRAGSSTMNAVFTWSPDNAVIVGTSGYVGKVTNLIITTPALSPSTTFSLNDVVMVAGQVGYIVGTNVAYKTVNNGTSWSAFAATPSLTVANLRAIHMFRNNSFMAVGDLGKIFCYNNIGWIEHPAGTTANLKDVFFHDDRNGYVVGDGGAIYKCSAPQNFWTYTSATTGLWTARSLTGTNGVPTPSLVNLTTVDFASRYHGFLGGYFNTPGITNANYGRLLNDESNIFSTRFWYDRLGRMVVSQNTKQYNRKNLASQTGLSDYSYTLYDALGRISEVGEKTENSTGIIFSEIFGEYINGHLNPNTINDARLLSWVNAGSRRQVTRTYYDNVIPGSSFGFSQENLRKRVSSVTYEDLDDSNPLVYQNATHYSYDIHGNVKTLWQENKEIVISGQNIKKTDYEYDLISGKVNVVRFQDGQPDAFYHYYDYDADNRIREVYTSNYPQAGMLINSRTVLLNPIWSRDAKYIYYAHGPLARIETGEHQSQGTDYAYTLQGWIKGVNSNLLTAGNDMGNDGLSTGSHTKTAKDGFGYSLNYYQGDYAAIDGVKWNTATSRFEAYTASSDLMAARYDIHNGNITAMVTTIEQPKVYTSAANEFPTILPQGTAYKYDQLNRILQMQAYTNLSNTAGPTYNKWQSGFTYAGSYLNKFRYDANGNILGQLRADGAGTTIDSLTYKYNRDVLGRLIQNRLMNVNESVTSTAFGDDIDNQTPGLNYSYDETGNLVEDKQEKILRIEWTVYGKIKKVIRTASSGKSDLEFKYDASGNRIAKIEKPDGSSVENGGTDNPALWTTTYYARDAQGNIMTTYKFESIGGLSSFKVIERNLFGSVRLGTENTQIQLVDPFTLANPFIRTLGYKYFEGSNHLGNVLTVFTDRKYPRDDNSDGTIDYFQPEIIAANDYTPFGAPMDGRTFSSNKYRYGMNGQEKDDEIVGSSGTMLAFTFREYDTRLGRFFAVDPLTQSYPELTPYQFASNTPIWARELEGLEAWYTNDGNTTSDEFGSGPQTPAAGPMTDEHATELGYTQYGVNETVPDYSFSNTEVKSFSDWNAQKAESEPGACIGCAVTGAEKLTGGNAGFRNSKGNNVLAGKTLYDVGANLQNAGYANEVPTQMNQETTSILNNPNAAQTENSAYIAGPAGAYHSILIIHNTQANTFSIFDQHTGWDVKNATKQGAQSQISDINSIHPTWGSRLWQLNKVKTVERRYPIGQ